MIDYKKIKTYPIRNRKNKFSIEDMVSLENSSISSDNPYLEKLAENIKKARKEDKQFILLMGAHPIKLGLSEFINDLIKKNIITHIGMNGAGPIHDFELAYIGGTSEDVAENIEDGSFGMVYETGHYLNKAAKNSRKKKKGLGYEIGKLISDLDLPYKKSSIIYNSYKKGIPSTVHTAIGTEIIYQHPECNGAALGESSYQDFKILAESISKLNGGVIVNLGCAVILPEVFLKAITVIRNLGYNVKDFTAANIDMIDHYRPRLNIVERPTSLGGDKFMIKERHEKSIPTLHYLLTN
jgi:deoxyhypusine synthase